MAHLRIQALQINVDTARGRASRHFEFSDGLNIIRADNSSGKSTALQAIIYALGLEGMLSPTNKVPLPHAVTDRITVAGHEVSVDYSEIQLTIRNAAGQIIKLIRQVAGPGDTRLIRVLKKSQEAQDVTTEIPYFVRTPGAATREAGFHRYLASFMGLNLPLVARLDGGESPLYLETLFPYFYVEQKHGWNGVQTRMPNHLRIREVGKRSAEFVLGLDALNSVLVEQRIRGNLQQLEGEWQAAVRAFESLAKKSDVTIVRPQSSVRTVLREDASLPSIWILNKWLPLSNAREVLSRRLLEVEATDVPSVASEVTALESALPQLSEKLNDVVARSSALLNERLELDLRKEQLSTREQALSEDLERHRDSQKLLTYGAFLQDDLVTANECPTCHQILQDGADVTSHPMSVLENIEYIKKQIALFRHMASDVDSLRDASNAQYSALIEESNRLREQIRAARDTLVDANNSPSVANIRARVQLEQRIAHLQSLDEAFQDLRNQLVAISESWSAQRDELKRFGGESISSHDTLVLNGLQSRLQQQLEEYAFSSLSASEVEIDRSSYRPANDGYDLGFDVSASDMVRVIWAYLLGMLGGDQSMNNHPGLLIFDEPRQQETAMLSFRALLRYAADLGAEGNQIIFATSEELASLMDMMVGKPMTLLGLAPGEKLLQLE